MHVEQIIPTCLLVVFATLIFFDATTVELHSLGDMTLECVHCHALGFNSENKSKLREKPFLGNLCCNKVNVRLNLFPELTREISELLLDQSIESRYFMKHESMFNAGIEIVSHRVDKITISEGIPGVYAIRGSINRMLGPMESR